MIEPAKQIKRVQDELINAYGETDYNKAVAAIKKRCDNNILIMAKIAGDGNVDVDIRLFAIAAMGE